jgi:hypothetical protein
MTFLGPSVSPSSRNYFSTWLEIGNTFFGRPAPGLVAISAVPPSATKLHFHNQTQFSAGTVMNMIIYNESRCWPLKTGCTQSLTKPFKTTSNNDISYLLSPPLTMTVPPYAAHFKVMYSRKFK